MLPVTTGAAIHGATMKEKYFDVVSDANTLIAAFDNAKKGSRWKYSVQKYEVNLLQNTLKAQKAIRGGTYEQMPYYEFSLCERGKTRPIKSLHISDRVIQRALCDSVLVKELEKYLIYDNGASMKNKGIDFARRRIDAHLHRYYRENKSSEGYILQIDFSKFFDNIDHEQLLQKIGEKIPDADTLAFIEKLVDAFKVDVSYMSEQEYSGCMGKVFNSLEHQRIPKGQLTGTKYMRKSLGIGSQISQIAGVFYPARIDNYCKIVKGIKYYGRYMDDIYIIHSDKEYLKRLLEEIDAIAKEMGLFLNRKKTQIVKLSHGFTFLQVKYNLLPSGKVLKRISGKAVTRERRKLKKYKKFLEAGTMQYKDIENAYQSWRGNAVKLQAHTTVRAMDKLYDELFIKPFGKGAGSYDTGRKRTERAENKGLDV